MAQPPEDDQFKSVQQLLLTTKNKECVHTKALPLIFINGGIIRHAYFRLVVSTLRDDAMDDKHARFVLAGSDTKEHPVLSLKMDGLPLPWCTLLDNMNNDNWNPLTCVLLSEELSGAPHLLKITMTLATTPVEFIVHMESGETRDWQTLMRSDQFDRVIPNQGGMRSSATTMMRARHPNH